MATTAAPESWSLIGFASIRSGTSPCPPSAAARLAGAKRAWLPAALHQASHVRARADPVVLDRLAEHLRRECARIHLVRAARHLLLECGDAVGAYIRVAGRHVAGPHYLLPGIGN